MGLGVYFGWKDEKELSAFFLFFLGCSFLHWISFYYKRASLREVRWGRNGHNYTPSVRSTMPLVCPHQIAVRHEFPGPFFHPADQRPERGATGEAAQVEVQQDRLLPAEVRSRHSVSGGGWFDAALFAEVEGNEKDVREFSDWEESSGHSSFRPSLGGMPLEVIFAFVWDKHIHPAHTKVSEKSRLYFGCRVKTFEFNDKRWTWVILLSLHKEWRLKIRLWVISSPRL